MIIPIILIITCFLIGLFFKKSIIGEIKITKKLFYTFLFIAVLTLIIGKFYQALYPISGLFSYWAGNLK